LQAFDSFLLKRGDEDRTRANRVEHVTTLLRNKEGRRAGPPVLGVSITIKYSEAPPEAYTRQELEDLFRVSCDEDKVLWRFFIGTGFRREPTPSGASVIRDLRNETSCPKGLRDYWLGHAGNSMDDLYDMVKDNPVLRKQRAAEYGIGFELPTSVSIVPNVPKNTAKTKTKKAA